MVSNDILVPPDGWEIRPSDSCSFWPGERCWLFWDGIAGCWTRLFLSLNGLSREQVGDFFCCLGGKVLRLDSPGELAFAGEPPLTGSDALSSGDGTRFAGSEESLSAGDGVGWKGNVSKCSSTSTGRTAGVTALTFDNSFKLTFLIGASGRSFVVYFECYLFNLCAILDLTYRTQAIWILAVVYVVLIL